MSEFQLTETTPPELSTYGSQQVNASFGITSRGAQLELMFWVRNLNKDDSLISTFPTVAQDGSYSGYPNQPRTWGANVAQDLLIREEAAMVALPVAKPLQPSPLGAPMAL